MSDQMVMYGLKGDSTGAVAAFKDVGAAIQRTEDKTNKLSTKMEQLQGSVQRAVANSSKLSHASEKSVQSMSAQSTGISNLVASMGNLSGSVSMVTGSFATMAVIPALLIAAGTAAGKLALDNADLVERLSILESTTGGTIDQLYSMRDIALASGVEFEGLTKSVSKMETELGKGNKALKDLGLTGGNSVEDIARVADAWNRATTTAEKNRIAMAAFGKSFENMIPMLQMGGDAIRALGDAKQIDVQKYRELDETADGISQAWRDIKFAIGDIAAGPLDVLLSGFKHILEYTRDTAEGWDAILSRKGGPNAGVAEAFLSKYATKNVVYDNPDLPKQGRVVTSVGGKADQLKTDFAGLAVQERQRILNGIYSLDKSTASATMRSLFGANGQINGLPVADLANMTKTAAADSKKTAPSSGASDAAQSAAKKELAFRADLRRQIAELTADSDQKEQVALKNKYDKLIEEHKRYPESLKLIYQAQNFDSLARQRDSDEAAEKTRLDFEKAQNKKEFQNPWESNEEARLARQMQEAGLIGENGVGVYDATQMSIEEMQEAMDNYRAAIDPALAASNQAASEMGDAWSGVTDSIAGDMASRFVGAFSEMRKGTMDLSDVIGGTLVGSLDSAVNKVLELGLQYALIAGFSALLGPAGGALAGGGAAATGGAAGGSGLGIFDFILKGLTGHADGTLSSPGGWKLLGERGTEDFETPYGQRGVATYGLYHVPAGTRVRSAESGAKNTLNIPINISGGDSLQSAETIRRIVREEFNAMNSDGYRTRFTN